MTSGDEFPAVLEAARSGAEWAWRALYRDVAPQVLGYLRTRTPHPEDVCADVFCELVRQLPRFDGDESAFRAWVFLIARHRLIDERRRRTRRPEEPSPEAVADRIAPGGVEDEVVDRDMDDLNAILSGLPEAQREVLLLRVIAGMSVQEVAKAMRRREGAIRALQHRALITLRATLAARNAGDPADGT